MGKLLQKVQSLQEVAGYQLLRWGFRIVMAGAGLALLFVAAIYYGLINP